MLFDLRSPGRRRLIKIIYGALALLMGGGLILFGVGSGGSGGLLDALGLTSGHGSGASGFESQISAAQKRAQLNPKDPTAQLALARIYVEAGSSQEKADPKTGQAAPTPDSVQSFQKAADAWDAYLKLKPTPVDTAGATLIAKADVALAESSTTASQALSSISAAAEAQKIVATAQPSQGSLAQLAIYLYFAGKTAAADQAAGQAQAKAQPGQRSTLAQELSQFKTAAAKFQQQIKAATQAPKQGQGPATPGASPFSNTLGSGGLGGPAGPGGGP